MKRRTLLRRALATALAAPLAQRAAGTPAAAVPEARQAALPVIPVGTTKENRSMRSNTMKAKLKAGEPAIGVSLTFPSPHMVEILAYCGFDWVLIDCEHGPMSAEAVETMVMASELSGIIPIVRPPSSWSDELPRLLDRGAMGVQMPHIRTADDARRAVQAVKYPPLGVRGMGASALRSATFEMRVSRNEYIDWVNNETLVCVQIEDVEAVRNLQSILTVEGVDVFFVGPTDLSGSLGHLKEPNHAEVREAVQSSLAAIRAAGRTAGCVGTPEVMAQYAAQGVNYLYTHVPTLMRGAASQTLEKVRGAAKKA
jgi:2-keto-3-deoxy-L-rhamnonate aldolase RhmA